MEGPVFRRKMKEPHPQFGITPCRLPGSQLPTNADVIGRLMMIRLKMMEGKSADEFHVSTKQCTSKVADEVMEVWKRSSLPTRDRQRVVEMVRQLWEKKEGIRKNSKEHKPASRSRVSTAVASDMTALFDISNRAHQPELEADREFLADQRGPRTRHIGRVDQGTTALWQRREERHQRQAREAGRAAASATASSAAPAPAAAARHRDMPLASGHHSRVAVAVAIGPSVASRAVRAAAVLSRADTAAAAGCGAPSMAPHAAHPAIAANAGRSKAPPPASVCHPTSLVTSFQATPLPASAAVDIMGRWHKRTCSVNYVLFYA